MRRSSDKKEYVSKRAVFISSDELDGVGDPFIVRKTTAVLFHRMVDGFRNGLRYSSMKGRFAILAAFLILIAPSFVYRYVFNCNVQIPEDHGLDYLGASSDFYALLISSIIALIGVLVTGFIFLSENIRGIVDSNPAYEHISEVTRAYIIKRLLIIAGISTAASILFIVMVILPFYNVSGEDNWVIQVARCLSGDPNITYFTSIFYLRWELASVFLMLFEASLFYSFKMIRMKDTMDWYTNIEMLKYSRLMKRPLVITLDGEEYNGLVARGAIVEDTKGVFRSERAFIFKKVYVYEPHYVYFMSEIRRDEVLTYLVNGHYMLGSADSDFDIKQTISMFDTVEKILARLLNKEYLLYKDIEELQTQFSPRMKSWDISSIADDISMRYFNIRDFRDMFQIRRTNFLNNNSKGPSKKKEMIRFQNDQKRYLEIMFAQVYVLLYETAPHLFDKNLEGLDLSDFNASSSRHKFNLSRTILTNCNLKNTVLTHANLTAAYLYHSNLSGADLRHSICDGANMADSVIDRVLLSGSSLEGINACDTVISENQFASLPMAGSIYKGAVLRDNEFLNCGILSASFESARIMESHFNKCMMNKVRFSDAILSESEILNCSVTEAMMAGAYMTHCQITDSDLSNSTLQDMNLVSVQFMDVDLSKCQADKTIFKSCQFFAPVFDDLVARKARFEDTLLTKYLLESRSSREDENNVSETDPIVLSDTENTRFLRYCLEYNGKTIYGNVSSVKAGAADNPIVSMCRAIFDESLFTSTKFEYVLAAGVSFYKCILRNIGFSYVNFSNSNFKNADMIYDSFFNCNLYQTDFSGAYLENCVFIQAEHINLNRFKDATVNRTYLRKCTILLNDKEYLVGVNDSIDLGDVLMNAKTKEVWDIYLEQSCGRITEVKAK